MCTSIAVGKAASLDKTLLVARNEDCVRSNWNKAMIRREQSEWLAFPNCVVDNKWTLGNGMSVAVPKVSYAYTGMPDACANEEVTAAAGNRFFFEERGINTSNFAISATNSLATNAAASAADPFVLKGLAECILPTFLLPQATSARHALDLLREAMASIGASEPNGLFLADPKEVWYVEIGSGHHWIAVRLPPDRYIAVSNSMRVHGVDLENAESVQHSEGLYDFVTDHKLLAKPHPHRFDFARAFGILGKPYNVDRLWLAQHLLTPSRQQPIRQEQYPLFLAPDKPVGPEDVMRVLRATYAGTPLEGLAQRPIGYDKTAESHVIVLDAQMPPDLAGLIWQCIGTPLCAPYLPIFAGLKTIPSQYALGNDQYDAHSAYWSYRGLYALAKTAGSMVLEEVAAMWRVHERDLVAQQRELRRFLKSPLPAGLAMGMAARYSRGAIFEGLEIASQRRNSILTNLTKLDSVPAVQDG
jgi:dipeptidase